MNPPSTRDTLIATLSKRLKGICAEWPEAEFQQMVERLADITIKYEGRIESVYDRRTADRLVTELNEVVDRNRAAREGFGGPDSGTLSAIVLVVQQVLSAISHRSI